MHSKNDFLKCVVFVYWENNNSSFSHLFKEQDSQLIAKKLGGGETKTALPWKETGLRQTLLNALGNRKP